MGESGGAAQPSGIVGGGGVRLGAIRKIVMLEISSAPVDVHGGAEIRHGRLSEDYVTVGVVITRSAELACHQHGAAIPGQRDSGRDREIALRFQRIPRAAPDTGPSVYGGGGISGCSVRRHEIVAVAADILPTGERRSMRLPADRAGAVSSNGADGRSIAMRAKTLRKRFWCAEGRQRCGKL